MIFATESDANDRRHKSDWSTRPTGIESKLISEVWSVVDGGEATGAHECDWVDIQTCTNTNIIIVAWRFFNCFP